MSKDTVLKEKPSRSILTTVTTYESRPSLLPPLPSPEGTVSMNDRIYSTSIDYTTQEFASSHSWNIILMTSELS